ncbi:MAG: Uma2 family endonuclease [Ilumatobacteraceae bacterium]|nr:Uma2 family endonuclease [Ilumatobacteraceae bacterium]
MVVVGLPRPFDVYTNGSYRQWEAGGHPALAVEVLSPSNTYSEMARKRRFYDQHGVDEYWVFEPQAGTLDVWVRQAGQLVAVLNPAAGWVSPTTGVHVRVEDVELIVHDSDGIRRWLPAAEEGAHTDGETAQANAASARADALQARLDEIEPAAARGS